MKKKNPFNKYERKRMGIRTLKNLINMYQLMLTEGKIKEGGANHKRLEQLRFNLANRIKFFNEQRKFANLQKWISNEKSS